MECQVAVFFIDGSHSRDFVTDLVLFAKEDYELNFEAKEKNCFVNATFLAIGGGGRSYDYGSHYENGGGSGYIEIGAKLLFANSSVRVAVGDRETESRVEVDGETFITASAGRSGWTNKGGDGYCGGGGGGDYYGPSGIGGAGGFNGGDGVNGTKYSGGHGNKLDLTTLRMKNFDLSPGKGGEPTGEF